MRTGSIDAVPRTQASACVTANGDDYVLIDPSPDVRVQIERTSALRPRARRGSPIAAIVLTNGDVDHCAGLLSLREWQPLAVYGTASVLRGLVEHNALFRTLDRFPGHVIWREVTTNSTTDLQSPSDKPLNLNMRVLAVPGKVPIHLEGIITPTADDNIGILIHEQATKPVFAYFPSVKGITDIVHDELERLRSWRSTVRSGQAMNYCAKASANLRRTRWRIFRSAAEAVA